MTKIETLQDARREKATQDEKLRAREAGYTARNAAAAAKFFIPSDLHPAIGVLTHAKGVTFYAYLQGYAEPHTIGTVEALTAALHARALRRF